MEDIGLSIEVTTINEDKDQEPGGVKCNICGKSFLDYSNCRKHVLRHNRNKGNECEICHQLFQGKQQKLQHMMFEHGMEKYEFKCQLCEQIFSKLEDLQKHSADKHGTGEQCKICWLFFKTPEEYQAHMDHHIETNTAQLCEICGNYYRDKFSLKLHMRSHTGEKPFDCPNCPEKFTARMYLFRHIDQKHVKDTPYHCELCNVSFKTIIQLRSHVKTKIHWKNQNNEPQPKKAEPLKTFKCPDCPKSFALQTYLTTHMRIHSDAKPYYCPVCSKGFVQVGNMNLHIRNKHQPKVTKPGDQKRFDCTECKASFDNLRAFKYHIRMHKKSQVHICKFCNKQFSSLSKCRLHEASHNPDSNVKCPGCLKVFFSWANLTRHQKVCKGKKVTKMNIKQEISNTESVNNKPNSHINKPEVNMVDTKIIKSEPVWDGENSHTDVQVGHSVLTIKSRMRRSPRRPTLTQTSNMNMNSNKPLILDSTEDDFIGDCEEDDEDSGEHVSNLISEEVTLTQEKQNMDPKSNSIDKSSQLLNKSIFNTDYNSLSRSGITPQVEGTSKCEPEGSTLIESSQSYDQPPELKTATPLKKTDAKTNNNESIVYQTSNAMKGFTKQVYEWIPVRTAETEGSTCQLRQLLSPVAGPPSPKKAISASQTNQFIEVISENKPPTVAITTIDSPPKTKQRETQVATQSVSDILSVMEGFDSKYTGHSEIKPEFILDEFPSGSENSSSKRTCLFFKVNDQLVELQYCDPDSIMEEEVSTSQDPSQDLDGVIPSSFDTSHNVSDIISSTNEFIEIKDVSQSHDINQAILSMTEHSIPSKTNQSHLSKDYACCLCNKQFADKSNLQHHMRRHNQNKGNECDICRKLFQGKQQVFQHKMAVHNIRPVNLTCEICGVLKGSIDELRTHGKEAHSFEYPFECGHCFKRYKDEDSYENHVTFHIKPFPCDICDKSYDSAKLLGLHYRSHTGERPHECQICHKTFLMLSHLKTHQFNHLEEKPYNCEICKKGFVVYRRLEEHRKTHEKSPKPTTGKTRKKSSKSHGRMFTCSHCNKTFKEKTYLTIHMRTHSGERPYTCPVCGKKFIQNGNMVKHWKTHDKPKIRDWLTCGMCEKRYRTNSELKKHQDSVHKTCNYITSKRDNLTLKCSICEKVLKSKNSYTKHMNYHTSMSYECQICHTWLSCEASLKKHIEDLHNPEHEFACVICDRRYPQQNSLFIHMKTHSDKNLQCSECEKRFTNPKSLMNHMTIHNDQREHKCDICSKTFLTAGNLVRHLKTHKENENVSQEGAPSQKKFQIVISNDSFKCVDCEQIFEDRSNFLQHVQSHTAVEYIKE